MKEICLDEGTIQAFLDGELNDSQMDAATHHLALCDSCVYLLSEAEKESAFAFAALDGEVNVLVPTQRLWSKINDSLTEEKRKDSFWFNFTSFISNLSRPSIAAFASLTIVGGLFAALFVSRPIPGNGDVAVNQTNQRIIRPAENNLPLLTENQSVVNSGKTESIEPAPTVETVPAVTRANIRPERNQEFSRKQEFSVQKAYYRKSERNQISDSNNTKSNVVVSAAPQFLPGEETYIRTIANLSETVNAQKDVMLKPSARFAFEKDLAMIDNAIDKMKSEVKNNPKNDAAKDILFASYQNKINLLNTVTERTELMASIK